MDVTGLGRGKDDGEALAKGVGRQGLGGKKPAAKAV
jgi:hypothetical protein